MSKYDRQIATAARLIKAKGQVVTWKHKNNTVNAAQPWKQDGVNPTNTSVYIVFLRPGGGLQAAINQLLKGTEVPEGSLRGLMAGNVGFVPQMEDYVDRNGTLLTVKSFDPISPDGTVILYDIIFAAS